MAPEEVVALSDRLAGVEADPKMERLVGFAVIARTEPALNRYCTLKRTPCAPERKHEPVALRLDLEAAVRGRLLPNDPVVFAQQLNPSRIAKALVYRGRALDIREHQRHRAIRRGVLAEVRSLFPHSRGHQVDRGFDRCRIDPLGPKLGGQ